MAFRARVFVTGASGFIGKHIVSQLLEAGYQVRGSVRAAAKGEEVTRAVAPTLSDPGNLAERLSFVVLDLSRDEGWGEAMAGMDALMHTASPFPLEQPANADDVIRPAVDGTRRALAAAHRAGIGRVVMTSSGAAVMYKTREPGRAALDETDWSEPAGPLATPYVRSKTLAERAAWDFAEDSAHPLDLTTINPAFVVGPLLDTHLSTSQRVIQRILRSKDPMLPQVGFPVVDVRDIAAMHVRALALPETVGKRFLGGDQFLWFTDIARVLREAYPERRITTRRAPNIVIRALSFVDASIGTILPALDRRDSITCDRARATFAMTFIDARDAIKATADSLIRHRLV